MELKYLGREEAPIAPETWKLLDSIMVDAAKTILTGRRVLNIEGPYGLGLKGFPLEDCTVSECRLVSKFVPVHMISRNFVLGVRDLVSYEQTGLPFFPARPDRSARRDSGATGRPSGSPGAGQGRLACPAFGRR